MKGVIVCVLVYLCRVVYGSLADEMASATQRCCNQGTAYGRLHSSEDCSSSSPPAVPSQFGSLCILAMDQCCKEYFQKKKDCDTGVDLAISGSTCDASANSAQMCCNECKRGTETATRGASACEVRRAGDSAEELLSGDAFKQCCVRVVDHNKKRHEEPLAYNTTLPTTLSGGLSSICDDYAPNELCAHHCIPIPGSYKCQCNPGHQLMSDGRNCKEVEENRCRNRNPCQHKCYDNGGPEVKCSCRRGYKLMDDGKSCQDIDECAMVPPICLPGTRCFNVHGSYKCIPSKNHGTVEMGKCPEGFSRNMVNHACDDINECLLPNPPCPFYLCENTIGGYKCGGMAGDPSSIANRPRPPIEDRCPAGFRSGVDEECEDVDECSIHKDDCNPLSQFCINTRGSFYCQDKGSKYCPPGFKINPRNNRCEDINECEEEDKDKICKDKICVNLLGQYDCRPKNDKTIVQCPEGMRLRRGSNTCQDIDECLEGTHLCDQHQNCLNTNGSHECHCKLGFESDATTGACVDVNECATERHDCLHRTQRCDNTVGSYLCVRIASCGTGYTLQHSTGQCEDIDECALGLSDCHRGGNKFKCVNIPGSFRCERIYTSTSTTSVPEYEYYYDSEEEEINDTKTQPSNERKPEQPSSTTLKPTTILSTAPTQPTTPETRLEDKRPEDNDVYFKNTDSDTRRINTRFSASPTPSTYYETSQEPQRPRQPEYPREPERPREPEYPREPERPREPEYPREHERPREPEYSREPERPTEPEYPREPERPTEPEYPREPERPRETEIPRQPERSEHERPDEFERPKEPERPEPESPTSPKTLSEPETPIYNEPSEPNYYRPTEQRPDPSENVIEPESTNRPESTSPKLVYVERDNQATVTVDAEKKKDGSVFVDTQNIPENKWTTINQNPVDCQIGFEVDAYGACFDIDECAVNKHSCSHTETCRNTMGAYVCDCSVGYRRELATGECTLIVTIPPTVKTTTVASTFGLYDQYWGKQYTHTTSRPFRPRNLCDVGYHMNSTTNQCEDVNECQNGQASCADVELCINTEGGYRCECPPHWTLDSVRHRCVPEGNTDQYPTNFGREPEYPVVPENPGTKFVDPVVTDYGNGRSMTCKWGYRLGRDNTCEDINECLLGEAKCGPQQLCNNLPGGYTCSCPRGHRLAGDHQCEDIDECQLAGTQPICSQNANCVNTVGSYHCRCHEGFRTAPANNKVCVDVDECSESPSGALCEQRCNNVWGGYRCSCHRGYRINADNRTCSDVDECTEFKSKLLCFGRCLNEPGSYRCTCPPGYRLSEDKRSCIDIDECETGEAPCAAGNTYGGVSNVCLNTRGGYRCQRITCLPGYRLEGKHRCTKIERVCHPTDWECAHQPSKYSYHFITFVSKLYIPDSKVNLFVMRGPSWPNAKERFELVLKDVNAPPTVKEKADINAFLLTQTGNQASVSLVRSLEGPQSIELELSMELYSGDIFGGIAVAKLFIHVSEYEF